MASRSMTKFTLFGLVILTTFVPVASAHHEVGMGTGIMQGMLHPFTGLDHLLAALAVGLWASQRGGRSLMLIPVAFGVALFGGGILAWAGVAFPIMESSLVFSVLALGLIVGVAANFSMPVSLALAVLFAIFHGNAHGIEMPAYAAPGSWTWGIALGTIAVVCLGAAIGHVAKSSNRSGLIRWAGGSIATAGLVLLFA